MKGEKDGMCGKHKIPEILQSVSEILMALFFAGCHSNFTGCHPAKFYL